MALFWRLLLAHLVADFPLQTDAVFSVKKEKGWGVLLHGTLFGLVAVLLARPFLRSGAVWGGLLILWLLHMVIDKAKLILIGRGREDHLAYFLLDQLLHIGFVGLISMVLSRTSHVASITAGPAADIRLIKLTIAYVVSIWASSLLCFYTQAAFSPQKMRFQAYQPFLWRLLGYVERGMLTAIVASGGKVFFLIPLAFLPRVGLSISEGQRNYPLWELALGSAIAIAAGLWARTLI
jgi:hypothetical protein